MFDWVQFQPERLTQPATLSGIVLAVAGLLLALFAGAVADAANRAREKKEKPRLTSLAFILRAPGVALIIIGMTVAILTA